MSPQCRQCAGRQWEGPTRSTPIAVPAVTTSPTWTVAVTGSYVVRSPPSWRTLTTPLPASIPANDTVPASAVRTR
ncbi:hypothetical protein GCM10011519_10600 [Marmoricola endophyticus]|uniref:Uncharacterized protein n=1 Tax=Marmoricola endophyticus TaxID=2040280 RepID=A0A917F0P4_9ACTN|nr:hypothetical protein GCM10011519_10600 [Marmoricola endophyticus]